MAGSAEFTNLALSKKAVPYLQTAERLVREETTVQHLPALTKSFPPLNRPLLDYLTKQAEQAALTYPRRSWAMMMVAEAATHTTNRFLQSLAAWQVARMANEWVEPLHVKTAVARARQGFSELGEVGWVAACDWQLYAIPWVHNNFQEAVEKLSQAAIELERANMNSFMVQCQMSLAFAYLLIAQPENAEKLMTHCEAVYHERDEKLNLIRCWQIRANALRRQLRYPEAIQYLERCLTQIDPEKTPLEWAKTVYYLAFCVFYYQGEHRKAEKLFLQAAEQFDTRQIRLRFGMAQNGLVQIYNNVGRLKEARQTLQSVRQIFEQYPILGVQADSETDSAALEQFCGNLEKAEILFKSAQEKYKRLRVDYMVALTTMYIGDAYAKQGRYLRALQLHEKAAQQFQELQDEGRVADCEGRLALDWMVLNKYEEAQFRLEKSKKYYEKMGRLVRVTYIWCRQAQIYTEQGEVSRAIMLLRTAVSTSEQHQWQLLHAFAQRLLAEFLVADGQYKEAEDWFETANNALAEIGAEMEQAACLVARGECYAKQDAWNAAKDNWTKALELSQGMMIDVDYRAFDGLAQFHLAQDEHDIALRFSRQAIESLTKLRHNLWQPALVGSFLRQNTPIFDRAVYLAVQEKEPIDLLNFVEMAKAQSFLQKLYQQPSPYQSKQFDEITSLAAEIRWLQERLRIDIDSGRVIQSSQLSQLKADLLGKAQEYEKLTSYVERTQLSFANLKWDSINQFMLDNFLQMATSRLGESWLAVDYYLTDEFLYSIMLSSTENVCHREPLTPRAVQALRQITRYTNSPHPEVSTHLQVLGEWLFPSWLQSRLRPDINLLIVPQGRLHQLPWAGLLLGNEPLVAAAIPVIIPSLTSLMLLWSRPDSGGKQKRGLITAVSDFQNRYPSLPQVLPEVEGVKSELADDSQILLNPEVTWQNLYALRGENGLAQFHCWHLATHATFDNVSGRLSSLALSDQDIWLDELVQLAPLPGLVTLSACSGGRQISYEGDEPVGLATLCLIAGTNSVIGSLWPVEDKIAEQMMVLFYKQWDGKDAGFALARALRQLWKGGEPAEKWGIFYCLGCP